MEICLHQSPFLAPVLTNLVYLRHWGGNFATFAHDKVTYVLTGLTMKRFSFKAFLHWVSLVLRTFCLHTLKAFHLRNKANVGIYNKTESSHESLFFPLFLSLCLPLPLVLCPSHLISRSFSAHLSLFFYLAHSFHFVHIFLLFHLCPSQSLITSPLLHVL